MFRFYPAMIREQRLGDLSAILEFLGGVYSRGGYPDKAREVIDSLEELAKDCYVCPYEVATIYAALGKRDGISIFGTDYPTPDGTNIRDYVHVTDLATAHVLALEALDAMPQQVYNLGTGTGNSVLAGVTKLSPKPPPTG